MTCTYWIISYLGILAILWNPRRSAVDSSQCFRSQCSPECKPQRVWSSGGECPSPANLAAHTTCLCPAKGMRVRCGPARLGTCKEDNSAQVLSRLEFGSWRSRPISPQRPQRGKALLEGHRMSLGNTREVTCFEGRMLMHTMWLHCQEHCNLSEKTETGNAWSATSDCRRQQGQDWANSHGVTHGSCMPLQLASRHALCLQWGHRLCSYALPVLPQRGIPGDPHSCSRKRSNQSGLCFTCSVTINIVALLPTSRTP